MPADELIINGERIDAAHYRRFHRRRIAFTLATLRKLGTENLIELGGHPWVMTSALIDEGGFSIRATVSAEEVTNWPDDIGVTRCEYRMITPAGVEAEFPNYSANVERTLFNIDERADTVIACEIIEHLLRSPHIMLLNVNRWLPIGGKLLLTTPNGAQFSNPLRRKSARPAYRCNVYSRHNGSFTLLQLVDIAQLCGFKVLQAGFWNVYERAGPTRLYSTLGIVPLRYFQEKFQRTIFIAAEKERTTTELTRLPKCYAPSPDWEYIRQGNNSARSDSFDQE
jgi:Methyltransferase domain